jgi:hypothetical protein
VAAVFVLPYLVVGLFWVFANPAAAAPDEDAHTIKALGMARFDIGEPAPPATPGVLPVFVRNASTSRIVRIPARLDPTDYRCFSFDATASAACQPAVPPTTAGDVAAVTTLGAYPPFLYSPVGWATSLGTDPPGAVRLGRLVILAASGGLLWLGCAHLVRWLGPGALLGVAVVLTPMAVFSFGILGTSAVEILGALGVAAVVTVYARRPESLLERRTLWTLLLCGTVLVLSRQLGVVTLAVLTAVLLALGGWREIRDGLGRPLLWTTVVVLALATAAVGLWELRYDHPALLGPWANADSLREFVTGLPQLAQESVGWFGWLDVRPPLAVNLVWFAFSVALLAAALVLGDPRDRAVLLGIVVVALLVSYVTYARVFFPVGAGLQGRHVLPIFALVPVWAGVVVAERLPARALRRAVIAAAVALPTVLLFGLYLNSARYAVGLVPDALPGWFVRDTQWSPPLGWYPWLGLPVVSSVLLGFTWFGVFVSQNRQ